MPKLYIFGIGGTGSRVIKSLAMLFASGCKLDNGFDTVVPILIDPDTSNGDLNRTKDILGLYQQIRNQVNQPDDFYSQKLKTINELASDAPDINPDYFQFKLNGIDGNSFKQYISFNELSDNPDSDDKNFVRLFYSESNLNSDISVGFKGNPNMGSIALNQFTNSEDFRKFGNTFGPGDAIFIINSIFGGTGAAGFPLLLKNLRGNKNLPKYEQIKDAPIGGLTYLPYFTLDENHEINAGSFEEKAKIAIDYYNRTIISQRKINVLHLIGNRGNTNVENYAVGGINQKNKAHFLEIAGALAIIEFCKNIASYSCINGEATAETQIKEFGIERNNENISFDDLNSSNKDQLYRPLAKFKIYSEYLQEGLEKAKKFSRWTQSKIFVFDKQKKSPCDESYFALSEYKNQIDAYNILFREWIDELSKNHPAFNPFLKVMPSFLYKNIDTQNCLLIDNIRIRSKEEKHTTLVKLFGQSTSKVYNKLPLNESSSSKREKKVFRLHQGRPESGWFNSLPLTPDQLASIKTEGREVATSIPSPFARIDLVKSAFRWVADPANKIEGNTAHHRLISDALDVAQLFYLSKKYHNKVEIVAYNPRERFNALIEQAIIPKHSKFAETLKLFWEQDSVDHGDLVLYNFERVNRLYLILNKNTRQVIGGTSPATLFFAVPDAHKVALQLEIPRSFNEFLFQDEYASLAKREPSFIRYIYALSKQPNFRTWFPEVYSYLDKIRLNHHLGDDMISFVTNLHETALNEYEPCYVQNNANDPCEILNIALGLKKEDGQHGADEGINELSDFTIKSDFSIEGKKPLVLPNSEFTREWTYTTTGIYWNAKNKIPYRNEKSPEQSKLPVEEDRYYWLSIGNFLEDKIIELPYSIDDSKFLCGANKEGKRANKYLLPLTPTFFKYFKAENVSNLLKLDELAGGGIQATLEIPVKKGRITYNKTYHKKDMVVKFEVHLALVPFIRVEKYDIKYTIGIIDDRKGKTAQFGIECFEDGEIIEVDNAIHRNQSQPKSYYYKTHKKFDILRLSAGNNAGFILPNWELKEGGSKINFAIDFGTTNTHIEYKLGDNDAIALDNKSNRPLWQSLLKLEDASNNPQYVADDRMFEREIMPFVFSSDKNDLVHFPLRTALVCNKNIAENTKLEPFRHTNNYLLYEKIHVPIYLDTRTRLKWSNYSDLKDESYVKSYIEFLVLLVFYKTLSLGGDPNKTSITWFYPVSMDVYELEVLFRAWRSVYESVFMLESTKDRINGIPESIAPYLYYRAGIIGKSLSVDIGGGSTDIAVFDEGNANAKIISSFKFAGNAIFGDGFPTREYGNNSDLNGFVNSFADNAKDAVIADPFMEPILKNILNNTKDSSDFSSLLFALEMNPANNFSYTRLLQQHRKMKLPIFVFYGAIAYYSANLLKRAGLELPRYILLSGTASKTASIIDPSDNFRMLSGMYKFIFDKVYQNEDSSPSIKLSAIPKEITCKGALRVAGIKEIIGKRKIKFWIGGHDDEGIWGEALDKEDDVSKTPTYGLIDDAVKKEIEASILEFYSFLDGYLRNIDLEESYNIELQAYEVFKIIREENIKEYLIRGIRAFHKKDERHVEETLFFYPLIGILNKLSFELSINEN